MIDKRGSFAYNKVKVLRQRLEWSQARLGKEVHVSARTIRNIEAGVHQPACALRHALEEWMEVVHAGADLAGESVPPTYRIR